MDPTIAVSITFDDNNQIRVLEADKYKDTENLKNESLAFLKSTLSRPQTKHRNRQFYRDGRRSCGSPQQPGRTNRGGKAEGSKKIVYQVVRRNAEQDRR